MDGRPFRFSISHSGEIFPGGPLLNPLDRDFTRQLVNNMADLMAVNLGALVGGQSVGEGEAFWEPGVWVDGDTAHVVSGERSSRRWATRSFRCDGVKFC